MTDRKQFVCIGCRRSSGGLRKAPPLTKSVVFVSFTPKRLAQLGSQWQASHLEAAG